MDYIINPIETSRLLLRPIELGDAESMFEYASSKENVGYIGFKQHESIEETKKIINEMFLVKKEKKTPETWAIILKAEQKMIGTIDFHAFNKRTQESEIGYILNQKYWNQGLMTEALKAVIQFGFKTFQLKTITAKCHPLNFSSSKVMGKANMEFLDCDYSDNENGKVNFLIYQIENKKRWK